MSAVAYKSFGEEGPNKPKSPVLELRIHGIRNSPPQEFLACGADEMEECPRDVLGGYWSLKKQPPAGPYIEAYSWGRMARNSPGSGIMGKASDVAVRTAWFLLIPFGLSNAAYWSRRLQRTSSGRAGVLKAGDGAGTVRLFALALTLFYVTAFSAVFLDLLAIQCFPGAPATEGKPVCSQLPSFLDGMAGWNRGQRVALFSVGPIAAILVLFVISHLSRVKYRPNLGAVVPDRGPEPSRDLTKGKSLVIQPILAIPGFWRRPHVSSLTGLLHVTGAVALIVVLITADFVGATWWAWWPLAAGTVLLGVVAVLLVCWSDEVTSTSENPRRRMATTAVLWLAALLYVTTLVLWTFANPESQAQAPFTGAQLVPLLLLAFMTMLAVSGLAMRLGIPQWAAMLAVAVASGALVWWTSGIAGDMPLLVFWTVTAVVIVAWFVRREKYPDSRQEAWSGHAPAVFMFFSVLTVAFLGSLLVHVAHQYLNLPASDRSESAVEKLWRVNHGDAKPLIDAIESPKVYEVFGGTLLLLIAAAALVMIAYPLWILAAKHDIDTPPVSVFQGATDTDQSKETVVEIHKRRRLSALAQRGEPGLGFLALITWAGLLASLAATTLELMKPGVPDAPLLQALHAFGRVVNETAAGWGLTLSGLLAGGVIVAGAASSKERPLGLLWDVMCFLPRAAHPFGPPCYADRVVPELSRRITAWLEPDDSSGKPSKRVLLSSHSLGTVLAAAALFNLHASGASEQFSRIKLLSYGIQLRPYFGRLFPELLGPAVLGTSPSWGASMFSSDPWYEQARTDDEALHGARKHTLRALLDGHWDSDAEKAQRQPNWINLWRRTDYLGFPVHSYRCNRLDRLAAETERSTAQVQIATHGNYFDTDAYDQARESLLP